MQLMTFNSLLMFDIVFMFFLFLVGVTCLVYYLPTGRPHRPLMQTAAESLLSETEKCRYRHRHLHLLSQKNGHADRILTDEISSEYEEDEDEINDEESDEFDEIPKTQSKKNHHHQQQQKHAHSHMHHSSQQIQEQQLVEQQKHHKQPYKSNSNDDKADSDTIEINFIEKHEIEPVKLHHKGYYPMSRQQQHKQQHQRPNGNCHPKAAVYPPCSFGDCEALCISRQDSSNGSGRGKNNGKFSNSMMMASGSGNINADNVAISINNDAIGSTASATATASTSRLMYLNEMLSLEKQTAYGDNREPEQCLYGGMSRLCGNSRYISNEGSCTIGIDNVHKNRKSNYMDYKKTPSLLKLKTRAAALNRRQQQQQTKSLLESSRAIERAKPIEKIQPIITLLSDTDADAAIVTNFSASESEFNVPHGAAAATTHVSINGCYTDYINAYDINDEDDEDDMGDGDDDDDDDDDCCSTTSVDIVLAEGIDDDASNVIIYDNKRKCQHNNCRNKYINNSIRNSIQRASAAASTAAISNAPLAIMNSNDKVMELGGGGGSHHQLTSSIAEKLREHFYVIKETEKTNHKKNGTTTATTFCNNCNSTNYSQLLASQMSSSLLSSSSSSSSATSSATLSTTTTKEPSSLAASTTTSTNNNMSTSSLMPLSSSSSAAAAHHQVLRSCNSATCPLLSSSSFHCATKFNAFNTAPMISPATFVPSPPGTPLITTSDLPCMSSSPSSGLRFSPSASSFHHSIPALAHQPYCCHVKAKSNELKDCIGPVVDV